MEAPKFLSLYLHITSGGAICGTFIVFGGLSVLLYKPWRRRIDRKRVRDSHFEPVPQTPCGTNGTDEESQIVPTTDGKDSKSTKIVVQPIEASSSRA